MWTNNPGKHNRFYLNDQRPYPALYSFREEDRGYFFGRGSEIKVLGERIRNNVLTVVLGKSGIGKTSLLQAGLIPGLRNEYYLPIYVRIRFDDDNETPIRQVKTIIEADIKALDNTAGPFGDLTLWEYFYNLRIFEGHVNPLLVFDQFEELFTAGKQNPEKVNPLVTEIGDLVQDWMPLSVQEKYKDQGIPYPGKRPDYRVIFSLREEYLPQLKNISRYMPSIVNGRYHFRVQQMKGEDAVEAVLNPGHKIIKHRDVAIKIIEKIPESKDTDYSPYEEQNGSWKGKKIEPFLLSLFCYQVNEKRLEMRAGEISEELVKNVKAKDIIEGYYEENIDQFETGSKIRIAIEEFLITDEGRRKLQDISSLKKEYDIRDKEIEALIDKRIIRMETRNDIDYIELIHDVLAPILKKSRDKRKEKERRLAEKRKREKELEEKNRKLRRNRNIIVSITMLLIVLTGLTWYAFDRKAAADKQKTIAQKQKAIAKKQAKRARSNELAVHSQMQSDKDPTLGFRLAEQAYRTDETNPHAYGALLKTFYSDSPFYRAVFKHDDNVNSAEFSPDGKHIVTASKDKTAKLWDLKGNKIREFKHDDVVRSACFSRDGKYIITTDVDGKTHYWDNPLEPDPIVNMTEISKPRKTTSDNKTLDIPEDSNKIVQLLDANKNVIMEFKGHTEEVEKCVFSPDEKYIVTAGYDDTARLWRIAEQEERRNVVTIDKKPHHLKTAVSPGKRYNVFYERKRTPLLRDTKSKKEWRMEGHEMVVNSAAFSPTGEHIVTAGMDETARLWNLKGETIRVFKGHKGSVNFACFSPDEDYIITAGIDKTTRLWSLNGTQVYEFKGFKEIIETAVFSVDGKYIMITFESGAEEYWLVDPEEIISRVNRAGVWQLDDETRKKYNL
jgi:WD40 repeat protein